MSDCAFEGSIDTDTPLQAAAREAGWALSVLVDSIAWEKRQQVSGIIERLALALLDKDAASDHSSFDLKSWGKGEGVWKGNKWVPSNPPPATRVVAEPK